MTPPQRPLEITPTASSVDGARIEAYAVFCGQVNQAALQRFIANAAIATNPTSNIGHIHLLFQSFGGTVGDGIFLYHFLRSLTIDLTIYNMGSVQSIAALAYLGAKRRKTSAHATFTFHRSSIQLPQPTSAARLQNIAESLVIDDRRTEAILRSHLRLSDEKWVELSNYQDLTFAGEEAVQVGIADEIGEFSPPPRTHIINL